MTSPSEIVKDLEAQRATVDRSAGFQGCRRIRRALSGWEREAMGEKLYNLGWWSSPEAWKIVPMEFEYTKWDDGSITGKTYYWENGK